MGTQTLCRAVPVWNVESEIAHYLYKSLLKIILQMFIALMLNNIFK